jgi:hypothetical protein
LITTAPTGTPATRTHRGAGVRLTVRHHVLSSFRHPHARRRPALDGQPDLRRRQRPRLAGRQRLLDGPEHIAREPTPTVPRVARPSPHRASPAPRARRCRPGTPFRDVEQGQDPARAAPAGGAAFGGGTRVRRVPRPPGWDRGLDVFGADLAQVGVVVHSVEGTAAGPLVWYRGSIVAGAVDTDLAIAGRWSSRWTASSTSTVDRVRSRSPIGRQRPCP